MITEILEETHIKKSDSLNHCDEVFFQEINTQIDTAVEKEKPLLSTGQLTNSELYADIFYSVRC